MDSNRLLKKAVLEKLQIHARGIRCWVNQFMREVHHVGVVLSGPQSLDVPALSIFSETSHRTLLRLQKETAEGSINLEIFSLLKESALY